MFYPTKKSYEKNSSSKHHNNNTSSKQVDFGRNSIRK